jgi:hypothetical protein
MNLFTGFLSGALGEEDELLPFIERWDALERLVIRVYKGQSATAADEAEYGQLRRWLLDAYPRFRAELEPLWREAKVAGELAAADPFARLMQAGAAADFAGDWPAMQNLPAAREALNRLILQQGPASA